MFPKEWFYSSVNRMEHYSRTPSAHLDPMRVISGVPYFKHTNDGVTQKKKTLIIHAPKYALLTTHQQIALATQLAKLQSVETKDGKGFDIYIKKGEEFLPFHTRALIDKEYFLSHEPASTDKQLLQQAAKALNLSPDSLYILNESSLAQLVEDYDAAWASWQPSERIALNESMVSKSFLARLLVGKETLIQSLDFSGWIGESDEHLSPVVDFSVLENLTINMESDVFISALFLHVSSMKTTLNQKEIEAFIAHAPILKHLKLAGLSESYNLEDLVGKLQGGAKLKTLDLSSCSFAFSLEKILAPLKRLEELNVSDCENVTFDVEMSLDLSSLKKLHASYSNLSTASLQALLSRSPNLEALDISQCESLSEGALSPLNLSSLKKLNASYSDLSTASLQVLLSGAIDLEALDISGCQNLSEGALSQLNLSSLKRLNVSRSNLSTASLQALLSRATSLEELDISYCFALKEGALSQLNLGSLKRLNVSRSNLSTASLQALLSGATNLEALDVSDCQSPSEGALSPLNLSSLKKLNVPRSNLSTASLQVLLSGAIDLEALDISGCQNLSEGALSQLNLSSLKKLNMGGSNLSTASLQALLSGATNLEALDVSDCQSPSEGALSPLNLSSLKILNLISSNLSTASLQALLSRATNLEALTIYYCETLSEGALSQLNLSSLKKLDVYKSNLGAASLQALLSRATSLEALDISYCKNLSEGALSQLNLSSLKKLKMSSSNLSTASLQALLSRAIDLEELTISCCENLSEGALSQLNLSSLKKLKSSSNLSTASLQALLSRAIDLEELTINDCKNLSEGALSQLKLGSLKKLNASHANLSTMFLQALLSNATSLEELDISYCFALKEGALSQLKLGSLKKLNASHANLSTASLQALLDNATNLEELDISYCDGLSKGALSQLNLGLLKKLNLTGSYVSEALIKAIQRFAPPGLDIIERPSPNHPSKTTLPPYELPSSNGPITPVASPASSSTSAFNPDTRGRIGADTTPVPNKKYDLNRIFYPRGNREPPSPAIYRLFCYQHLKVEAGTCSISEAFSLSNDEGHFRQPNEAPESADDTYALLSGLPDSEESYYAKQTLRFNDNDWQALPSLSPNDLLKHYHVTPRGSIEIEHSTRDSLYYVRRKLGVQASDITIDFVITIPAHEAVTFPKEIDAFIESCRGFAAKPLEMSKGLHTGKDYLEALKSQKTGACRHRAAVFKSWMSEHYPATPVRIVNNVCHSFVEIYYKNKWRTIDLGGYAAELKINEPPPNVSTPTPPTVVKMMGAEVLDSSTPKTRYLTPPKTPAVPHNILDYTAHLMRENLPQKLMMLNESQSTPGMRHHLEDYCKRTHRASFYINTPDDLSYAAPYIELENGVGKIKQGPGGALYNFLKVHPDGLIIINYDKFTPSEIVRYHGLIDEIRTIDGYDIPKETSIIGLFHPDAPTAYDGADFYSRFGREGLYTCPLAIEETPYSPGAAESAHSEGIDVYGGGDWESILLGAYEIDGKDLIFKEGELIKALRKKHTSITLYNAPWENESFQRFLQEARLRQEIRYQGLKIPIPEGFKVLKGTREDLAIDRLQVFDGEVLPKDVLILNPMMLSRFLGQYECKANQISMTQGLLEAHKGKTLTLYVSDNLSLPSWGRLLDAAKRYDVTLKMAISPSVSLPAALKCDAKALVVKSAPWDKKMVPYLETNDTTASLRLLPEDTLVLDISEMDVSELITALDATFNPSSLDFSFTETEGLLKTVLKENRPIALVGRCSEETGQYLQAFLMESPQANVVVISEHPGLMSGLPVAQHQVSVEDKKALLKDKLNASILTPELLEKKSLSQLEAILRYDVAHPGGALEDAWMGHYVTADVTLVEEDVDASRLASVASLFKTSPFVFLAGMTGVGKTTFVQSVWCKKYGQAFMGEGELKAWATSTPPAEADEDCFITLFIDEANITSRHWSEFEGMFERPPFIRAGKDIIPLSKRHRVMFAGNPLSYGGERQLPRLFETHGGSVLFKPMPPSYIKEKIIKPLISELYYTDALIKPFMAVYEYLIQCSQTDVLLSPREIGMMSLLAVDYLKAYPSAYPGDVASYYAHTLSQRFVPESHRSDFDKAFARPLLEKEIKAPKDIEITKSLMSAAHALHDFIALRKTAIAEGKPLQGGLGGLILEGPPGVGKTALIAETLVAHGVVKYTGHHDASTEVFYHLSVTLPPEEKEALLLKAFHEGAIVVVDEFNSATPLERLMNALLMGKDAKGNAPQRPGFMLFATQNPVYMAKGRASQTAAQDHRLHKVLVSEPAGDEMILILQKIGLSAAVAQSMVAEYQELKALIDKDANLPPFCFRDLVRRAKSMVQGGVGVAPIEEKVSLLAEAAPDIAPAPASTEAPAGTSGRARMTRPSSSAQFNLLRLVLKVTLYVLFVAAVLSLAFFIMGTTACPLFNIASTAKDWSSGALSMLKGVSDWVAPLVMAGASALVAGFGFFGARAVILAPEGKTDEPDPKMK